MALQDLWSPRAVAIFAALSSYVSETGELLVSIRPNVIADHAHDRYALAVMLCFIACKQLQNNFHKTFFYTFTFAAPSKCRLVWPAPSALCHWLIG